MIFEISCLQIYLCYFIYATTTDTYYGVPATKLSQQSLHQRLSKVLQREVRLRASYLHAEEDDLPSSDDVTLLCPLDNANWMSALSKYAAAAAVKLGTCCPVIKKHKKVTMTDYVKLSRKPFRETCQ